MYDGNKIKTEFIKSSSDNLKMKVIFLDVDGVLNSDEYFDKIKNVNICGIESEIDVEKIKLLKKATLLAITENGFGKRTELDEYRVQIRGGKGVITYKITPKTGKLVGVKIATEEDDVMLITDTGTIIRLQVKDISVLGRSTQGVTLMRTSDGGKVVSIETLTPDMENPEEK